MTLNKDAYHYLLTATFAFHVVPIYNPVSRLPSYTGTKFRFWDLATEIISNYVVPDTEVYERGGFEQDVACDSANNTF